MQTPSSPAIIRAFTIQNLQRIAKYTSRTAQEAARLAYINKIFEETMKEYHTLHLVMFHLLTLYETTENPYSPVFHFLDLMKKISFRSKLFWILQELLLTPLEITDLDRDHFKRIVTEKNSIRVIIDELLFQKVDPTKPFIASSPAVRCIFESFHKFNCAGDLLRCWSKPGLLPKLIKTFYYDASSITEDLVKFMIWLP